MRISDCFRLIRKHVAEGKFMIEVEVKLKIDNIDEISEKLLNQEYHKSRVVRETDVYFNAEDRDFRTTDEALRIRKVESLDDLPLIADGSTEDVLTLLTYKGPKLDDVSMTRKEIEIIVEDFDKMSAILESLRFHPVRPVVKCRTEFLSEYVAACVDEVEGLGSYLELEVMVDSEEDKAEALKLIEDELGKLGHSMDDTITTSYLSMLERKS